jgi:hypothetical protein
MKFLFYVFCLYQLNYSVAVDATNVSENMETVKDQTSEKTNICQQADNSMPKDEDKDVQDVPASSSGAPSQIIHADALLWPLVIFFPDPLYFALKQKKKKMKKRFKKYSQGEIYYYDGKPCKRYPIAAGDIFSASAELGTATSVHNVFTCCCDLCSGFN